MSDIDDFFGETEPQKVKRAKVKGNINCPILYCDDNPNLNVFIAEYLSEKQIKYVAGFFKRKGAKINLVYVFSVAFDNKHNPSSLAKFFVENVRSDLNDYLEPKVPIVTIGRAILATTFDSDIQIAGFYDSVFNNTYFFSPFVNNRIYPIDTIFKICAWGQFDQRTGDSIHYFDCWETYFAEAQIERALKAGNCSLSRKKSIQIVKVENPVEWLVSHTENVPDNELWVAVDTETGGLNKLSDSIGDVTFSFDGWTAYHLDWKKCNPKVMSNFLKAHKIVLQNAKYDLLFLMFHGCDTDIYPAWDTWIAGHLLNEMRSNSLKAQAFYYTGFGGYDLELEKYKWQYPGLRSYLQIPDSLRISYACYDAAITYQVWKKQVEVMEKEPDLFNYYKTYCIPMLKVYIKAEYKGFCIDWKRVTTVGELIQNKLKEALKKVREAFNKPDLNPNKKQELGEFIKSLGWPCINRNKIGGYKVSKKEFAEWEKMGFTQVKTLIEYSKWAIVWNTFIGEDSNYDEDAEIDVDIDLNESIAWDNFFSGVETKVVRHDATGLWQYKGVDNRIHATFYPFLTKSHRTRSSSPNLQNLSKRDYETASLVRSCYIPPDVVPCSKEEATEVWVFDQLDGLVIYEKELFDEKIVQNSFYNLNRVEYYKRAEPGEYFIFEIDSENIQARIAASMSLDKNLCELFLSGGDFHNNNMWHILAKHQLFDEYTIEFEDGITVTGMEWETFSKVVCAEHEKKNVYYDDIYEGDIIDTNKVVHVSKVSRKITQEELNKNAKKGRLKKLRDVSKSIGLSFLFGASAVNLATTTLRNDWTPARCEEFIKERGLENEKSQIIKNNKHLRGDDLSYYVVASFFRNEFFKIYPELEKWILECARDASVTGYRISPFGSRRLLPQLTTKGKHADGAMYKNLCNIAVNSPVQDYETVAMSTAMIAIDTRFEDLGYLSYICGSVHDSVVTVNHVSELDSSLRIMLEAFNFKHPANNGIAYNGECNVADYTKGEFWGFGHREVKLNEVKSIPIIQKKFPTRGKRKELT